MINSLQGVFQKKKMERLFSRHGEIVVFIFLILMMIVASQLSDLFLKPANLSNILRQAAPLGVVAIGQTIVILIFGIDLSVSSVATVASVIAAVMMMGDNEKILPAIAVALGVGIFIGFVNGFLVTKFKLPDFIVTLATWSIVNGLMFVYTQGREVGSVAMDYMLIGSKSFGPFPLTMLIWFSLTALMVFFLRSTRMGRHLFAVGGNAESARLSGINIARVKITAYIISGFLAAMGGLVLLSRLGVGYPLAGRELQLDSIAAVVIGGTSLFGGKGSVLGTLAGVFIISALNNIFNLTGVSAFAQLVLKGLIIIIVVALRARGEK